MIMFFVLLPSLGGGGGGYIPWAKSEKTYILIYFNIPTISRFIFFVKIHMMNYIFRLDSQEKPVLGLVHEFTSSLVKNWLTADIYAFAQICFCPKFDQTSIFLNETNFM